MVLGDLDNGRRRRYHKDTTVIIMPIPIAPPTAIPPIAGFDKEDDSAITGVELVDEVLDVDKALDVDDALVGEALDVERLVTEAAAPEELEVDGKFESWVRLNKLMFLLEGQQLSFIPS